MELALDKAEAECKKQKPEIQKQKRNKNEKWAIQNRNCYLVQISELTIEKILFEYLVLKIFFDIACLFCFAPIFEECKEAKIRVSKKEKIFQWARIVCTKT